MINTPKEVVDSTHLSVKVISHVDDIIHDLANSLDWEVLQVKVGRGSRNRN